ncbi:hypothetical protein SNE35_29710 [Paucibacter sp. R3-3]|uniref:Uncharacterized protein n=1 Tax=Roseateles agri TaxID=3098619 RepID=A0ABU5DQW3_9BURK|nr:hypothetical protein [Paucibacter sp. R3-3]MDY0748712.1 hypothetical protein [Paucibacter sp. R3-3]
MSPLDPAKLREAVAYETYLLLNVYRLLQEPLQGQYERVWIYPRGSDSPVPLPGRPDHHVIDGVSHWSGGFRVAGGPLIVVTAFKVLDMIVEWIIGPPKSNQWQFNDKAKTFEASVTLPALLKQNPWLTQRFSRLYRELYPLRNTLIHTDRFRAGPGGVAVAPSLGRGAYGDSQVPIQPAQIAAIASVATILARCLDGSWAFNAYLVAQLKWRLDQLASFHREETFGAKQPQLSLVRILRDDQPSVDFDVAQILNDVNQRWLVPTPPGPAVDMRRFGTVFDIEIGITNEGPENTLNVYRIPMTEISRFPIGITKNELQPFLSETAVEVRTFTGSA